MKAEALARWNSSIVTALLICFLGCGKGGGTKENAAPAQVARTTESSESLAQNEPAKAVTPRPERRMDRCQWNMATLAGNYLDAGHRDASWDEAATNALSLFADIRCDGRGLDEERRSLIAGYCKDAVLKGCQDPVILYLHTKFVLGYQDGMTDAVLAEAYRKAAAAARKHPCATIREFYIALRTSECINYATGNKASSPDVHRFRRGAFALLREALEDSEMPPVEVYEACRDLLAAVSNNSVQYGEFYEGLEPLLLEKWPDESFVFLLKGTYHIHQGWRARGTGFADSVTQEGWKQLGDHLNRAAESLEKAWSLNPTNPQIATEMMRVELGQGKGRKRMELWFGRAMALDTNSYAACNDKLYYLEPKWYGSAEDMLDFGRECVASTKWGGRVPLILAKAHDSLAAYAKRDGNTNYWKNVRVWRDLHSAYEKFFSLNPDAFGWRHDYARHAYWCEQWDAFNQQLTRFGPTNYSFFGGQESFERMVKTARERVLKPVAN